METSEIVKAIVDKENIDLVIVVDALCAKNYRKLAHVIQINDVGINPGSGIGNYRQAINEQTMGTKVIAIGIPTVIYASSLVSDVLNQQKKELTFGQIGKLNDNELEMLFNEVLDPIDCNFVLSDKQIDEQCEIMSKIISKSINSLRY